MPWSIWNQFDPKSKKGANTPTISSEKSQTISLDRERERKYITYLNDSFFDEKALKKKLETLKRQREKKKELSDAAKDALREEAKAAKRAKRRELYSSDSNSDSDSHSGSDSDSKSFSDSKSYSDSKTEMSTSSGSSSLIYVPETVKISQNLSDAISMYNAKRNRRTNRDVGKVEPIASEKHKKGAEDVMGLENAEHPEISPYDNREPDIQRVDESSDRASHSRAEIIPLVKTISDKIPVKILASTSEMDKSSSIDKGAENSEKMSNEKHKTFSISNSHQALEMEDSQHASRKSSDASKTESGLLPIIPASDAEIMQYNKGESKSRTIENGKEKSAEPAYRNDSKISLQDSKISHVAKTSKIDMNEANPGKIENRKSSSSARYSEARRRDSGETLRKASPSDIGSDKNTINVEDIDKISLFEKDNASIEKINTEKRNRSKSSLGRAKLSESLTGSSDLDFSEGGLVNKDFQINKMKEKGSVDMISKREKDRSKSTRVGDKRSKSLVGSTVETGLSRETSQIDKEAGRTEKKNHVKRERPKENEATDKTGEGANGRSESSLGREKLSKSQTGSSYLDASEGGLVNKDVKINKENEATDRIGEGANGRSESSRGDKSRKPLFVSSDEAFSDAGLSFKTSQIINKAEGTEKIKDVNNKGSSKSKQGASEVQADDFQHEFSKPGVIGESIKSKKESANTDDVNKGKQSKSDNAQESDNFSRPLPESSGLVFSQTNLSDESDKQLESVQKAKTRKGNRSKFSPDRAQISLSPAWSSDLEVSEASLDGKNLQNNKNKGAPKRISKGAKHRSKSALRGDKAKTPLGLSSHEGFSETGLSPETSQIDNKIESTEDIKGRKKSVQKAKKNDGNRRTENKNHVKRETFKSKHRSVKLKNAASKNLEHADSKTGEIEPLTGTIKVVRSTSGEMFDTKRSISKSSLDSENRMESSKLAISSTSLIDKPIQNDGEGTSTENLENKSSTSVRGRPKRDSFTRTPAQFSPEEETSLRADDSENLQREGSEILRSYTEIPTDTGRLSIDQEMNLPTSSKKVFSRDARGQRRTQNKEPRKSRTLLMRVVDTSHKVLEFIAHYMKPFDLMASQDDDMSDDSKQGLKVNHTPVREVQSSGSNFVTEIRKSPSPNTRPKVADRTSSPMTPETPEKCRRCKRDGWLSTPSKQRGIDPLCERNSEFIVHPAYYCCPDEDCTPSPSFIQLQNDVTRFIYQRRIRDSSEPLAKFFYEKSWLEEEGTSSLKEKKSNDVYTNTEHIEEGVYKTFSDKYASDFQEDISDKYASDFQEDISDKHASDFQEDISDKYASDFQEDISKKNSNVSSNKIVETNRSKPHVWSAFNSFVSKSQCYGRGSREGYTSSFRSYPKPPHIQKVDLVDESCVSHQLPGGDDYCLDEASLGRITNELIIGNPHCFEESSFTANDCEMFSLETSSRSREVCDKSVRLSTSVVKGEKNQNDSQSIMSPGITFENIDHIAAFQRRLYSCSSRSVCSTEGVELPSYASRAREKTETFSNERDTGVQVENIPTTYSCTCNILNHNFSGEETVTDISPAYNFPIVLSTNPTPQISTLCSMIGEYSKKHPPSNTPKPLDAKRFFSDEITTNSYTNYGDWRKNCVEGSLCEQSSECLEIRDASEFVNENYSSSKEKEGKKKHKKKKSAPEDDDVEEGEPHSKDKRKKKKKKSKAAESPDENEDEMNQVDKTHYGDEDQEVRFSADGNAGVTDYEEDESLIEDNPFIERRPTAKSEAGSDSTEKRFSCRTKERYKQEDGEEYNSQNGEFRPVAESEAGDDSRIGKKSKTLTYCRPKKVCAVDEGSSYTCPPQPCTKRTQTRMRDTCSPSPNGYATCDRYTTSSQRPVPSEGGAMRRATASRPRDMSVRRTAYPSRYSESYHMQSASSRIPSTMSRCRSESRQRLPVSSTSATGVRRFFKSPFRTDISDDNLASEKMSTARACREARQQMSQSQYRRTPFKSSAYSRSPRRCTPSPGVQLGVNSNQGQSQGGQGRRSRRQIMESRTGFIKTNCAADGMDSKIDAPPRSRPESRRKPNEEDEQNPPGVVIFQVAARFACFGGIRVAGGVRVIMDANEQMGYVQVISPMCQAFITYVVNSLAFLHSSSAAGVAWSAVVWQPDNDTGQKKKSKGNDSLRLVCHIFTFSVSASAGSGSERRSEQVDSAQVVFCEPFQAHRFRAVLETIKAAFSDGDGGVITPSVPGIPGDPCGANLGCPPGPSASNKQFQLGSVADCFPPPEPPCASFQCATIPAPPPPNQCLPMPLPCPPVSGAGNCCPVPPPFCTPLPNCAAGSHSCGPTPNPCQMEEDPHSYMNAYGKTLFCERACLVKLGKDDIWAELHRGCIMVIQEPNCMGYSIVLVNEEAAVSALHKLSRRTEFKPSHYTQNGFVYNAVTTTDRGSMYENFLVSFVCKKHADQFQCVTAYCHRNMMLSHPCPEDICNNNQIVNGMFQGSDIKTGGMLAMCTGGVYGGIHFGQPVKDCGPRCGDCIVLTAEDPPREQRGRRSCNFAAPCGAGSVGPRSSGYKAFGRSFGDNNTCGDRGQGR